MAPVIKKSSNIAENFVFLRNFFTRKNPKRRMQKPKGKQTTNNVFRYGTEFKSEKISIVEKILKNSIV